MDFPERDVRRQCELTHIASRRNVIGNHGSPLVFRAQRSPIMLSHVRCLSAAHCLPDRGTDRSALRHRRRLGLADALADGPKDPDALAREVGAHADMMNRLMRALASFGVFEQLSDGRFANTSSSEYLRSDAPGSLRGLARMYGGSPLWQAWAGLEHSVRSGEPSFKHVHGMPMFEYLAAHGGRERSEQEFRDLFARAGLRLARVVPTRVDNSILEVTK